MANDEQKIKCPKCGELISPDEVLTRQIEEKVKKETVVFNLRKADISSIGNTISEIIIGRQRKLLQQTG